MPTDLAIHATSASRLECIRGAGFRIGAMGRRGPGVYFWEKGPFWEEIGRTWHRTAAGKGDYEGDNDARCGIIHAVLEAPPSRFLDLESAEFKRSLHEVVYARNFSYLPGKKVINDLWVMLIHRIEKKTGTNIAYFRTAVELPGCSGWYPIKILGNPIAFVVRDPTVIKISDFTVYEEAFHG